MALTVVKMDKGHEKMFLDHVTKDPSDYFLFILDWKKDRKSSKFFLALENGKIAGILLIYKKVIAQFRGSNRALKALVGRIRFKEGELVVPVGAEDVILKAFSPVRKKEMHLLRLSKGGEDLATEPSPVKLATRDAKDVAGLMRAADPKMWSEQTTGNIKRSMQRSVWIGIRSDGKLAAVGMARVGDQNAMIHTIATAKRYRNRGFATAVVSALVTEMFKDVDEGLIHVFKANGPAYHVYRKVGFRPYKRYIYIKGRKRAQIKGSGNKRTKSK